MKTETTKSKKKSKKKQVAAVEVVAKPKLSDAHAKHQAMLEEHKYRKQVAKERHHPYSGKPWHRIKVTPLMLAY